MNHYAYLEKHFLPFYFAVCQAQQIPVNPAINNGLITAHGDKCYTYRERWEQAGIAFEHGVAIYLLTYVAPWSNQVRDTPLGWVQPSTWVLDNAPRFTPYLAPPLPTAAQVYNQDTQ